MAGFRGWSKRNQTPESAFRSMCLKWLKLRFSGRIWHMRTIGGLGQRAGIPDDLFCVRTRRNGEDVGVFLAIEWKAPGVTRLGPRQKQELEAIRAAGGIAGMVNSLEALEELVSGIEPTQLSMRDGKQKPRRSGVE